MYFAGHMANVPATMGKKLFVILPMFLFLGGTHRDEFFFWLFFKQYFTVVSYACS